MCKNNTIVNVYVTKRFMPVFKTTKPLGFRSSKKGIRFFIIEKANISHLLHSPEDQSTNVKAKIIMGLIYFFFIVLLFLAHPAQAVIYKYVDKNGVVHFTDAVIDIDKLSNIEVVNTNYSFQNYRYLAEHYALKFGLDPDLVKKIIQVESGWNPYAVSKSGAMGLMQLMPETAKILGVKNPFDPEENIKAGVKYLKYLLELFHGDTEKAIAAYNAGPTSVLKHKGIPPIQETIRYLKKINLKDFMLKETTQIYKIQLPDGTYLFTNTPIEGLKEF